MSNKLSVKHLSVARWSPESLLKSFYLATLTCSLVLLVIAQTDQPSQSYLNEPSMGAEPETVTILPPLHLRPNVSINIRDWTRRLSESIRTVSSQANCLQNIEHFFEKKASSVALDPNKLRDTILSQINTLLSQHRAAVSAIVAEAERLVVSHNFVKNLRFNYTDVHRLRNELLDGPLSNQINATNTTTDNTNHWLQAADLAASTGAGQMNSGQTPQFTSINGGTPVPGPPEWQTPFKSIVMQTNKNFGDIPVNTSMSAVHLSLPIYPGLPEIMNGIAWTERLDGVFKRNLAQYAHVHHQYYGDHLGFLRTFPAHKWRIARTEPDLFDARSRPWYIAGAAPPKDVVILIDTSGSMTGLRREIAKGVVFEILDTLTNNDYFAVMRFSETVTPIGIPKCQLRTPKLGPQMDELCSKLNTDSYLGPFLPPSIGAASGSSSSSILGSTGMTGQPLLGQQQLQRDKLECAKYAKQQEASEQYLRDHPNVIPGKNGSYLTDEMYRKSVVNITHEISDAYLLPATSRNIRYLKSNFSMPTAGIANFTHALMAAFELLQAYDRSSDLGSQCQQAIMLITDGAIKSHDEIFNRYNYPNSPVRVFTYMIGREVGDITHTKAMACNNRGYYTHVINLSEVREQVQKYLPVMARSMVLAHQHPVSWTWAYGDETYQVLTDWVLETKRRERARIMLNEERERLVEANSSEVINIELTNITEYDELPLVDEELKNRIICEDSSSNLLDESTLAQAAGATSASENGPSLNQAPGDSSGEEPGAQGLDQSLQDELDPLGYNELGCHWASRRADLLTSVVKPVFDNRNSTLYFQRILHKNIWTEQETHVRNAQLLGVAAVDLRIADIVRAAPSHLLGPNAYVTLMGPNGFVLHHPDLRALLEDPFDKQSKILKPYFNAVDLTHLEQVHVKNDSESTRRRDEGKLFKLRELALKRGSGSEVLYVKRAVDCRRRLHIRQQAFYYGPIKETPFVLMLALPQNYGLNRLSAELELDSQSATYFTPSSHGLLTVHPDYRYCELLGSGWGAQRDDSVSTILEAVRSASNQQQSKQAVSVDYEDLTNLNFDQQRAGTGSGKRIACDQQLFPSLLFDAAATYEPPESSCRNTDETRSTLANIYGLEMSFLATRSGLTRVKVFDLTPRIKKLADMFIKRHNRAVDEPWYSRTVDWSMRFNEEATIITAPYNAYIRLIAKLRQRITQRHPALNDTRSNCDPLFAGEGDSVSADELSASEGTPPAAVGAGSGGDGGTGPMPAAQQQPGEPLEASGSPGSPGLQSDEPAGVQATNEANENSALSQQQQRQASGESRPAASGELGSGAPILEQSVPAPPRINYNEYSSFDFLDLLSNSSVHIYATQSVIHNKGHKQRAPVAVSGLLYDYANFARRFLNATSLNIRYLEGGPTPAGERRRAQVAPGGEQQQQQSGEQQVKVEFCPGGQCATRCGDRNDTIDCLLVDNNGFIVVGEELPHIGRSLVDYDEKLMQSLVERRLFHQVHLTDFQAICAPAAGSPGPVSAASGAPMPAPGSGGSGPASALSALGSQISAATPGRFGQRLDVIGAFLSNLGAAISWLWSMALTGALYHSGVTLVPGSFSSSDGHAHSWLGWAGLAEAQSAVANQSLLALLPNKTYLRPCEKSVTLYEFRPVDPSKLTMEQPEYYVTRCGCSGWYVYDAVPKTNLIMLIVNTTSACRRCELSASGQPASPLPSNYVPVLPVPVALEPAGSWATGGSNRTAEEQVCAMLERDLPLYTRRPDKDTCYSFHPDELNIHLCGAGAHLGPAPVWLLLALGLLLHWLAKGLCSGRSRRSAEVMQVKWNWSRAGQ